MISVSIDIGSTWTKGAVFEVGDNDNIVVKNYALSPTTPHHLAEGFFSVLNKILGVSDARPLLASGKVKIDYSSSAKGGLSVAAIGLVPNITLESAKVTAHSAGAKVSQHFAYNLNKSDVRALEKSPPDILLFTGGTDGGDCSHGLLNAKLLAQSDLECAIIYAGNRDLDDEVQDILGSKDLTIVDNVLPNLDSPNPYGARKAICDIFLHKIVKGKGLDIIVDQTGEEPLPTPYSVFELVQQIRQHVPDWETFMLIDMGGATTDIYSSYNNHLLPDTVMHGLPEPLIKRTVEGDLGMRVSAINAGETGASMIDHYFAHQQTKIDAFHHYLKYITTHPGYVPSSDEECVFDQLLAGICVGYASERHAGTKTQVCTCAGNIDLQLGRDLSLVQKVIGTGGWLSRADSFDIHNWLKYRDFDDKGKQVLLPNQFEYYRDTQGLLPLLANVARRFPKAAAQTGVRILNK
ncbi:MULTISPECIES: methylaspartate mutase accessory protein GlmL [Yersinia]|uniref:methylaspartate mutase accessory protein GlmL n=1 Tax=Yersinia TaxID=629 RepID=UPI0005DD0DC3|nr:MULTISPECIES: methylaspartate mutase accessory protein GlmL [Yersinia]OVZ98782.1 glutamate mutase [Yersinia frederiksenii]RXA93915.1 glutamate mutase [Yersinia sp. 2105 StPb PI]CNI91285.1 glutamate mutase [Yersinia frederiksenii]CNJ08479.1 glutamate mutase [Yersinia frederiksenii]